MQKILVSIILMLFFTLSSRGQAKEYKLVKKVIHADINIASILSIDTINGLKERENAFNPVKGKYTVYVFKATYRGLSYDNSEKEFHDILVLKTDKKNKILDAFQYTLEWAEMPLTYDLYKAEKKGIYLKNRTKIDQLNFQKVDYNEGSDRKLNESGILVL